MLDCRKVIERLQNVSHYFKSMLKVGYDGDADIYREHRESVKMATELLKEQKQQIEQNEIFGGVPARFIKYREVAHNVKPPIYYAFDKEAM